MMIHYGKGIQGRVVELGEAISFPSKAYARPRNVVPPTILGATTTVGSLMTIDPGQWEGMVSFITFWSLDGQSVGTTGPTYTVLAGDTGKTLTAAVLASNPSGGASAKTPGRLL